MTQFNPGTVLTATAVFTKAGGPGKFDGAARWVSDNPNDTFTQVDDAAAGTSVLTLDGSANTTGNTSTLTCTVDGDLGKGQAIVEVHSDPIEWTDAVDIEADGGTITMSQPTTASDSLAAAHRASRVPGDPAPVGDPAPTGGQASGDGA